MDIREYPISGLAYNALNKSDESFESLGDDKQVFLKVTNSISKYIGKCGDTEKLSSNKCVSIAKEVFNRYSYEVCDSYIEDYVKIVMFLLGVQ